MPALLLLFFFIFVTVSDFLGAILSPDLVIIVLLVNFVLVKMPCVAFSQLCISLCFL
ncbi:MAG: hypothetical protein WCP97_08450 [bacterium]